MCRKIIGGITVIAIAAVAAWNVSVNLSSQKNELSDILLANVAALASEDTGGANCKWKNIQCPWPSNTGYGACLSVGDGNTCTCGNTTHTPTPC